MSPQTSTHPNQASALDTGYGKHFHTSCHPRRLPMLLGACPWRGHEDASVNSIVRPPPLATRRWNALSWAGVRDCCSFGSGFGDVGGLCGVLHIFEGTYRNFWILVYCAPLGFYFAPGRRLTAYRVWYHAPLLFLITYKSIKTLRPTFRTPIFHAPTRINSFQLEIADASTFFSTSS